MLTEDWTFPLGQPKLEERRSCYQCLSCLSHTAGHLNWLTVSCFPLRSLFLLCFPHAARNGGWRYDWCVPTANRRLFSVKTVSYKHPYLPFLSFNMSRLQMLSVISVDSIQLGTETGCSTAAAASTVCARRFIHTVISILSSLYCVMLATCPLHWVCRKFEACQWCFFLETIKKQT